MSSQYWVNLKLVVHLLEWLTSEGYRSDVTVGEVLKVHRSTGRVPVAVQYRIWEQCAAHFEPGFALRAGASMAVTALPTIGPLMAVTLNIRKALLHLSRRGAVISNAVEMYFEEGAELGGVVQRNHHPDHPIAASESALANWAAMVRLLAGRAIKPRVVWLPFSRPDEPYHQEFFGSEVVYSAPVSKLLYARSDLDIPLLGHDPEVEQMLEALANQRAQRASQPLTCRCRAYLRSQQVSRGESLRVVASRLGMSARSLQRGLESEGMSYRILHDEALAERAMRLLADPAWNIDRVAAEVGYDRRSFHRAFSRWTGHPPGAWRQSLFRKP